MLPLRLFNLCARRHSKDESKALQARAVEALERRAVPGVAAQHDWRMAPAAQALGIQRPNLYRKARQLGIPLVRVSE